MLSNDVLNRLQPHAEQVIGEYQAGFRSCMDHIHTLRLYLAARLEHQLDTHLIFVDFQKAYDTARGHKRRVVGEDERNGHFP